MNSNTTDTTFTPVAQIPGFDPGPVVVGSIPGVSKKLGAPMSLRAAVGAARTPADKLKTIRKFYPDAVPTKTGEYEYTDPNTAQRVVFNPPGLDRGDFVQNAPMIGEMVGGVLGAAGGGAASGVLTLGAATAPGAIAGAGAGAMAGKELVSRGVGALTGAEDTRGLGRQAVDAGVAGLSGAAGEGVGQLIAPVGRAVAGRVLPAMSQAGQAAARLGIPVGLGVQTGKQFFKNAEAALASAPLSTGIIKDATERSTMAAGNVAGRIANQMAGGASVARGEFSAALKEAAKSTIRRFEATRSAFDDAIGMIPGLGGAPVHMDNVGILARELPAQFAGLPRSSESVLAPAKKLIDDLMADAAGNGGIIPFSSLRNLRTKLGEMAYAGANETGDVIPGAKQALQDLYGAATRDLRIAAKAVDDEALTHNLPNPGALQAIDIHDAYVALNRGGGAFKDRPVTLETFQKLMDLDINQPLKWAEQLVRNPAKAKALRNGIAPEEWDTIAGSVFKDMGRAAPGSQGFQTDVWSPSQFLTNWNKLGKEGREAMFGGGRYAAVQRPINDLARIAESLKDISGMKNTSNTARALLGPLMMGGAMVVNPTKSLAFGLSQVAAAKLLTSPAALQTITRAVTQSTEKGAGPFIARLITIGRTDKALGDAINEYLGVAHQAGLPMPNYQGIESLNASSPAVQFTPR